MKGKLQNTTNGWMIQYEHCGINNISFYPLHPDDPFNNSIEKYEGKEVEFILVSSLNVQEEKLIEVAIINANITDVPTKQQTLYTEEDMMEYAVWFTIESNSTSGRNRTGKELLSEWEKQHKQIT